MAITISALWSEEPFILIGHASRMAIAAGQTDQFGLNESNTTRLLDRSLVLLYMLDKQ